MAKTFTIKALADGQLPAAAAALYTVPASTSTIIKTITISNTDSVTRTVNLYINANGVNRRIIPQNLPMPQNYTWINNDELTLETGDMIQGDASAANVVDYTINGIEET